MIDNRSADEIVSTFTKDATDKKFSKNKELSKSKDDYIVYAVRGYHIKHITKYNHLSSIALFFFVFSFLEICKRSCNDEPIRGYFVLLLITGAIRIFYWFQKRKIIKEVKEIILYDPS